MCVVCDVCGVCPVSCVVTVVPYTQADCPYPLKYNYDGESSFAESGYNGQDMCVMPCPNPMWSDAEWTGGITIMMIVGGCSFILAAFMVITLCLMPAKRRYPGSLFIYIVPTPLCSQSF